MEAGIFVIVKKGSKFQIAAEKWTPCVCTVNLLPANYINDLEDRFGRPTGVLCTCMPSTFYPAHHMNDLEDQHVRVCLRERKEGD